METKLIFEKLSLACYETLAVSSSKNFLLPTQKDLLNKPSVKVSTVLEPKIGKRERERERDYMKRERKGAQKNKQNNTRCFFFKKKDTSLNQGKPDAK